MYGQNPTAHQTAQIYHRQPLASYLGVPQVVTVASGVMGAVVPYQFTVSSPQPEGVPHSLSEPLTMKSPPTTKTVKATPTATTVAKVTEVGSTGEMLLAVALIVVIAGRVYVRLMDAAGNVLAHADG